MLLFKSLADALHAPVAFRGTAEGGAGSIPRKRTSAWKALDMNWLPPAFGGRRVFTAATLFEPEPLRWLSLRPVAMA